MYRLVLLILLFLIDVIPAQEREYQWVKENNTSSICCNSEIRESEVFSLHNDGYRVQTMILRQDGSTSIIDGDTEIFKTNNPGWIPYGNPENITLCVNKTTGVTIEEDDKMTISCKTEENHGLGKTRNLKIMVLRVYRPVSIEDLSSPTVVNEGETITLECNASGFPNLQMRWIEKSTGQVLNQSDPTTNAADKQSLELRLVNASNKHHNQVFECQANTSQSNDPVSTETRLSVTLSPKINLVSETIYTDLGVSETFEIDVAGLPTPVLYCPGLTLGEPTLKSDRPRGGTYAYPVQIDRIQPTHLKTYRCEASNDVGSVERNIVLTASPSIPRVQPVNFTPQADYYLLHWTAHSKAPLENVTVDIVENMPANFSGSPLVLRRSRNHQRVFLLHPDTIDNTSTSVVTATGSNGQHRVWHHLPNLTEDTDHGVVLRVCNKHNCTTSELDPKFENHTSMVFRTAKFDGSNKIDPEVLKQPPLNLIKPDTGQLRSAGRQINKNRSDTMNSFELCTTLIQLLLLQVYRLLH